jgi:DHA3 family macrolide efflux protein-like MFS transporter
MEETQPGPRWQKRFFTIWTGQASSLLGSGLVSFALVWWLTAETGSETVLALGALFTLLPTVLLSPFSGSFVDRLNRRKIMIVTDGIVALLTLFLYGLFRTGQVQVWHILAVNFLRSLGGTFQQPAMMASTTLMVPKEHLTRIGGMNRILNGLLRIIVPPAGALLIEVFTIESVLLLDIATAAVAIALLFVTPVPQPAATHQTEKRPSVLAETRQGLRFVHQHPSLFYVVMTCTMANVFLGPALSFKPLLITQIFGGGPLQLSYMSSITGLGIIAGGLIMGSWTGFRRKLIISGLGWAGVGVFYVIISLLPGQAFAILLICSFAIGLTSAIGGAPLDAYYQTTVPPEYQGRVFAVLSMLDNLTVPFGLILAAILGGRVPLRIWFLLVGISHAVLGIGWQFSRRIRQAEEPEAGRQ